MFVRFFFICLPIIERKFCWVKFKSARFIKVLIVYSRDLARAGIAQREKFKKF
jgi:hypothetical protein